MASYRFSSFVTLEDKAAGSIWCCFDIMLWAQIFLRHWKIGRGWKFKTVFPSQISKKVDIEKLLYFSSYKGSLPGWHSKSYIKKNGFVWSVKRDFSKSGILLFFLFHRALEEQGPQVKKQKNKYLCNKSVSSVHLKCYSISGFQTSCNIGHNLSRMYCICRHMDYKLNLEQKWFWHTLGL